MKRTFGAPAMVILKRPEEIEKMRTSNRIVQEVLQALKEMVQPGVTTRDLDRYAEEWTRRRKARPSFKAYMGYPYALCASVNAEVVHGMPSDRVLREGDIVGLDFGVYYDGYHGDAAITVAVGRVSPEAERLMNVTQEGLFLAVGAAQVGNRLGDIGAAVQEYVEGAGFSVVRDFVGHGIGRDLHEEPQVPNYGVKGRGMALKRGMVLAVEPMVNQGTERVRLLPDGWTVVTEDGKLSAHFEHSVAITDNGPDILSAIR